MNSVCIIVRLHLNFHLFHLKIILLGRFLIESIRQECGISSLLFGGFLYFLSNVYLYMLHLCLVAFSFLFFYSQKTYKRPNIFLYTVGKNRIEMLLSTIDLRNVCEFQLLISH